MPVIGYLTTGSPALLPDRVRAFHQGLSETGFVEGQNLAIEYRGIDGRQYGRLAAPGGHHDFCRWRPCRNGWVSDAPPVEAIEIAAYSPEWPVRFEASKELIAQALPGVALNIEHVGSTAVPNLAAKPIIDMDLIVDDPTREETYVPALAALGYVLTIRERTWYEHRM